MHACAPCLVETCANESTGGRTCGRMCWGGCALRGGCGVAVPVAAGMGGARLQGQDDAVGLFELWHGGVALRPAPLCSLLLDAPGLLDSCCEDVGFLPKVLRCVLQCHLVLPGVCAAAAPTARVAFRTRQPGASGGTCVLGRYGSAGDASKGLSRRVCAAPGLHSLHSHSILDPSLCPSSRAPPAMCTPLCGWDRLAPLLF